MTSQITIRKINEVYIKINAPSDVLRLLYDHYTFEVVGYQHTPAYRNGFWDGKIRLFNIKTRTIYIGLLQSIVSFLSRKIKNGELVPTKIVLDVALSPKSNPTDLEAAVSFLEAIQKPYVPHDYQKQAFLEAVKSNKALIVSPTGSGKSYIINLLMRWYDVKTLTIVPTISLIEQMKNDLISYGFKPEEIHQIYSGKEKHTTKQYVISSWQSLHKLDSDYFNQFEMIIGDEAHLFSANALKGLMEKTTEVPIKFGTTGTLKDSKVDALVLEGLFGRIINVVKTKELIDDKILSDIEIRNMILSYDDKDRKAIEGKKYKDEIEYLIHHQKRNDFIKNLCLKQNGNILVLFSFVEKHGMYLYDLIRTSTKRKVFFCSADTSVSEREEIRRCVDSSTDNIIVASYGTFSTGINIKNLNVLIFSAPSKSKVRVLQSIGRVLRKSSTKNSAILYDIVDDLRTKEHTNYVFRHFRKRLSIYKEEGFEYKNFKISMKGDDDGSR